MNANNAFACVYRLCAKKCITVTSKYPFTLNKISKYYIIVRFSEYISNSK